MIFFLYIHPGLNNFQSQRFFNAVTNCCEDAMEILMSMAHGSHVSYISNGMRTSVS